MHGWHLRGGWQVVVFRLSPEDEQRMRAADARLARVVNRRILNAACAQVLDPLLRADAQIFDLAELDRLRRTRGRARRLQSDLLPVVTERALERAAIGRAAIDDAEGAGDDAVAAAVADVGLDVDAAEFRAHDRTRGARLETAGVLAVLAHVGREVPAEHIAAIPGVGRRHRNGDVARAFDELHVPPRRMSQPDGVVV